MRFAVQALRTALGALALVALVGFGSPVTAQHGQDVRPPAGGATSGFNPTAASVKEDQLLRELSKLQGRISIPDGKAALLEQPQGREWRGFHERWLPWIVGIAIVGMLLALAAFYFTKGRIAMEHTQESGRKIIRFNAFERFTHWMTATCFILLALTGVNYVFGKHIIMPVIGPNAFAALAQWGKYAHNFLSWPFMLGILIMLVIWVRDNFPSKVDWTWLKAGGGFFNHTYPAAGRFNAGQKIVFWIVVLFGLAMSVTGIIMLFPFSATDINGMQVTSMIHSVIGAVFIAAMLAHIYIGSLGMEGAYDAMGTGEVDLAWARCHHSLWVDEQQAKTASGPQIPRGAPAPAE